MGVDTRKGNSYRLVPPKYLQTIQVGGARFVRVPSGVSDANMSHPVAGRTLAPLTPPGKVMGFPSRTKTCNSSVALS